MKNLLYYGVASLFVGLGMVSCGDNTDFTSVHVLTADELAEMARQDSILEEQKKNINADFLYDYSIDIFAAESYDGGFLEIDYPQMAKDFGISETELLHGIANMRAEYLDAPYADAAKISGFAIQGSDHSDLMTAYNTNGFWGHWWDENGDVTSWGDNARVFLEYYDPEEEGEPIGFNVGQMPGTLTPGQSVTVLECLKYQDLRMALRITVNAKAREEVKGGIVGEENLSISLPPNGGSYEPNPLAFDLNAALTATGLTEIDPEVNLVAYKDDGSFWSVPNADMGFWFDKSGPIGGWGDAASCWISYGMLEDPSVVGVCLMPGATAAGDVYNHDFGFINGDKIYMLHITINVEEGEQFIPEVKSTQNVEVTVPINYGDYVPMPVAIDLAQILADLGVSEIDPSSGKNLYGIDMDGAYVLFNNADNGFWYDKTGPVGGWGENASCWISYGMTDDPATIGVALMPGATAVGDVYEHDFGFHNGNNASIVHVTLTVGEEAAEPTIEGTIVHNAAYSIELNSEATNGTIEFDLNELLTALGVEDTIDLQVISKKADGSFTARHTADANCGFWFGADGTPANYGESNVFVNYYGWDAANNAEWPEDVNLFYVGYDVERCAAGDTYTVPFGLMSADKIVMYEITFNIK